MYLYFGTCRQVICEMFIVWISVLKILVEKMISPVMFDTDHIFKWQNTLFLTKKLFIRVYVMRRSRLVLFLQGEFLCFSMCWQVACKVFIVWRSSLKKWYLRFYLTQIVPSNGKMLVFQPRDWLSKFLWRTALVKSEEMYLPWHIVPIYCKLYAALCQRKLVHCWQCISLHVP